MWIHWDPVRLEAPCCYREEPLTEWTECGRKAWAAMKEDLVDHFEPGVDYVPASTLPDDGHEYIILPETTEVPEMTIFRSMWMLRRARRPYVLAPTNTPLPTASQSKEQRARIYSVYLRPWTLNRQWASHAVPWLKNLNRDPTIPWADPITIAVRA